MSKEFKIDELDRKILEMLKKNARLQWREIGEEIHLTGQAVGERVRRLIANNVITGFHAAVHENFHDEKRTDFVSVIMTSSNHQRFVSMIQEIDEITELYRISGNSCYMLKVECNSQDELNEILEKLLSYANYSLNSVVKRLK